MGTLLGVAVYPADEIAARQGSCTFVARAVSEEGVARYRIVRSESIAGLRRFFAVARVSCAGIAANAPRAAECASYARLAEVADPRAYCEIRWDLPERAPIEGVGERAFFAGGAAFVERGQLCLEAAVERDGAPDAKKSEALARLVMDRLP